MKLVLQQQYRGEINLPSTAGNGAASPVCPHGQDIPSQDKQGAQQPCRQLEELILLLQGKGQIWILALPKKATRVFHTRDIATQCCRELTLLIGHSFKCKW